MATDPFINLVVFALAALAIAVLCWPRRGLLARLLRVRRASERIRLEDALKHLHDYAGAGRTGTLENLAGRLEISRGAASELLERLAERGLVAPAGGGADGAGVDGPRTATMGWSLTEAGRAYALRILRTHRLWERYLADRTGVPAREWHAEAERVEHHLSEEEAEALAARLGHPRYDPHGDPIPTRAGDIPESELTPLTRVAAGRTVVVRHVEDEPAEIYERLAGAGLAPGAVIEVRGIDGGSLEIAVDGRETRLRRVDAGNVSVDERAVAEPVTGPRRTLAEAGAGEEVRVAGISPACQGMQRRRLLDLGVVPGTRITPELVSASGDPVAYRIRGALIALRREQARWVEIEAPEAALERAG